MDSKTDLREVAYTNQSEGYRLLLFSEADNARPYFARADLEIARMYWRAADQRSLVHFGKALEAYSYGQMMQNPQIKLRAAYGSAYIQLFLEEFDQARREAQLAYQLERLPDMLVPAPLSNLYGELSFIAFQEKIAGMTHNVTTIHNFIHGNRDTLPQRELLQLLDLQDFFKWRLSHAQ